MTKRIKWIFGSVSLTATIAIVPAAVISCSAQSTESNTLSQNDINNYITKIDAIKGTANAITGANAILPSNLTSQNMSKYLNNIPTIPSGIILTYTLSNSNDSTGTVDVIINASSSGFTTTSSVSFSVSGFLSKNQSLLKAQIDAANLQANANMPVPIASNVAVSLANAQSILINFNTSASQNQILNNINDLTILVANSSITAGIATLEFSANINGVTTTYSQQYSGFFAGSSTVIQTHLQEYLTTPTNAASFLQNYLNLNQSFLNTLVVTQKGTAYWGYTLTSSSSNNFKNINVTYDATTKIFSATATTTNVIDINSYSNSTNNFEPDGSTIPVGTQLTIPLPFVFSSNMLSVNSTINFLPIIISVSDFGNVTLSWPYNSISSVSSSYQQTIGIQTQILTKGATTTTSLILPWRIPTVSNINF